MTIHSSIVHFVFGLSERILQRIIRRIPLTSTKWKALKYVGACSRKKGRVSWNRICNEAHGNGKKLVKLARITLHKLAVSLTSIRTEMIVFSHFFI